MSGKNGESEHAEDCFSKSFGYTNVPASSTSTSQAGKPQQLRPLTEGAATSIGAFISVHYVLTRDRYWSTPVIARLLDKRI